jgi:hypothetical protein
MIEISDTTYQTAMRIAALDDVDMGTLIEDLVLRHAQYIDMLQKAWRPSSGRSAPRSQF